MPIRPVLILDAKRRPVAVAELKLRNVAMQVLFLTVLVNALHAALENGVIALKRVGMNLHAGLAVCVTVLADGVADGVVARILVAKLIVVLGLIGHNMSFARDVFTDDRQDSGCAGRVDMERTSASAALDQCQDNALVRRAATDFRAFLFADEGFEAPR